MPEWQLHMTEHSSLARHQHIYDLSRQVTDQEISRTLCMMMHTTYYTGVLTAVKANLWQCAGSALPTTVL